MHARARTKIGLVASCLFAMAHSAAWSDDADALAIESSTPAAAIEQAKKPGRVVLEATAGWIQRRYGDADAGMQRLSLDLAYSAPITQDLRFGISNRLDVIRPRDDGLPEAVNSLREAYLGWSGAGENWLFEIGRINLRLGPSYGYNPTDYFRSGTVRVVTTPDPMAQRENRQGVVMARAQRLWTGGAASLILAPRVRGGSPDAVFSTEFSATNPEHRALLMASHQLSDAVNGQLVVLFESSKAPKLGASATALVNDHLVAHAEVSSEREQGLFASCAADASSAAERRRSRVSAGLTVSLPNRLSVTVEGEYDGHAPELRAWQDLFARSPARAVGYLQAAQFQQQLAAKSAWLVYIAKRGFLASEIDLSALVRVNAEDNSQIYWAELRRHWEGFDLSLQWQATRGRVASQFGVLRQKQSLQLVLTHFF